MKTLTTSCCSLSCRVPDEDKENEEEKVSDGAHGNGKEETESSLQWIATTASIITTVCTVSLLVLTAFIVYANQDLRATASRIIRRACRFGSRRVDKAEKDDTEKDEEEGMGETRPKELVDDDPEVVCVSPLRRETLAMIATENRASLTYQSQEEMSNSDSIRQMALENSL